MADKKIEVFLGGFINSTNAQNLNCLAIAKHLDKEKFEVFTLELFSGNLESQIGKISGVKIFNCFRPFRLSGYIGFLWGIWNCDVAYLPKHEFWKFNRFLLKLFGKKSFSTIEGILDDETLKSAIEVLGSKSEVFDFYSFTDKLFPITHFIRSYNIQNHNLKSENKTLYLGCENALFNNYLTKSSLKKVVYIGRLKKRKGIYDFLDIAQNFPELEFIIFGDGEAEADLKNYCLEHNIQNCKLLGVVSHFELSQYLRSVDLHIFPSRSEGFGKVTFETASAGIPSIVYNDYGASEWINSGENGWVVKTKEEIINIVALLQKDSTELKRVSKNAILLAQEFDWSIKINDWEMAIENIYYTK